MSAAPRNWRDSVWLLFFAMQMPIMLFVDLVVFYPEWFYVPPNAPFHFLFQIRDWYKATYNDPFFSHPPPWFEFFGLVEALGLFPFAVWSLWRFSKMDRGTTGPQELATLIFAFWYAMTTATCINDLFYWDPAIYSWDHKKSFIFEIYGPWLVWRECNPSLLLASPR